MGISVCMISGRFDIVIYAVFWNVEEQRMVQLNDEVDDEINDEVVFLSFN